MIAPTQPTIVAANPLPADVDWSRVESELGVRIVQGAPWSHDDDTAALRGRPRGPIFDNDGDAGRDQQVMGAVAGVADLYPSLRRICDALEQGRDVLVLTEPDLVAAVMQLLRHGSPRSSVVPTSSSASAASASSSQGAVPEGSDVEGSASADSSTSRGSWDVASLLAAQRETNALLRQVGDHVSTLVAAQSVNLKVSDKAPRNRKRG